LKEVVEGEKDAVDYVKQDICEDGGDEEMY